MDEGQLKPYSIHLTIWEPTVTWWAADWRPQRASETTTNHRGLQLHLWCRRSTCSGSGNFTVRATSSHFPKEMFSDFKSLAEVELASPVSREAADHKFSFQIKSVRPMRNLTTVIYAAGQATAGQLTSVNLTLCKWSVHILMVTV